MDDDPAKRTVSCSAGRGRKFYTYPLQKTHRNVLPFYWKNLLLTVNGSPPTPKVSTRKAPRTFQRVLTKISKIKGVEQYMFTFGRPLAPNPSHPYRHPFESKFFFFFFFKQTLTQPQKSTYLLGRTYNFYPAAAYINVETQSPYLRG